MLLHASGRTRSHLAPPLHTAQVAELARAVDAVGFSSLRRAHDSITLPDGLFQPTTHSSGHRVTVRRGQDRHWVYDFYGAPDGLRQLEQRLLAIGGFAR